MGDIWYVDGSIEIQPPLQWGEAQQLARFLPADRGGDVDTSLEFEFEEQERDGVLATVAYGIKRRWDDGADPDRIEEDLAEIVAALPGRTFEHEFTITGDSVNDAARVWVADGVVRSDIPTVTWPGEAVVITRDQLHEWAGRDLTDDEVHRIQTALPHSSIPQAVASIVEGMEGGWTP